MHPRNQVAFSVIAMSNATKQSRVDTMDCFAETVIRRRCTDPLVRNDGFKPVVSCFIMVPAGERRYSAACDDGERMVSTPSASVAEIVVRTIRRASCAGHGRPRCMVARLSHITTSPLRHWCR